MIPAPNQISLSLLRTNYDAIVLSYGADADKHLPSSLPGVHLSGIYSARQFVGWYNGHPEFQHLDPDLLRGDTAVVVGHGNVALDVARILLCDIDVLRKTDITEHAIAALSQSKIKHVKIVGRRGPAQASFTNKEVRELMTLDGVGFIQPAADVMKPFAEGGKSLGRVAKRLLQLLQRGSTVKAGDARKTFEFEFLKSPAGFIGDDNNQVSSAMFDIMELQGDPLQKDTKVKATGETVEIPCAASFLSIGYKINPISGVEEMYDDRANHLTNDTGKVVGSEDNLASLYAAGWTKRGPVGVIAETMYDAFETAELIVKDFESGLIGRGSSVRHGWQGVMSDLGSSSNLRIVSWQDWQKIDRSEREMGTKLGKEREKVTNVAEMLKILE